MSGKQSPERKALISDKERETEPLFPKSLTDSKGLPYKSGDGELDPESPPANDGSEKHVRASFTDTLSQRLDPMFKKFGFASVDAMTYPPSSLETFAALVIPTNTIWTSKSVWKMMGMLVVISIFVGVVTFFAVSDPASIEASKFQKIGLFLRVFVGLLLGFFPVILRPEMVYMCSRLHGAGRRSSDFADPAFGISG
jgi:hypothetical protein